MNKVEKRGKKHCLFSFSFFPWDLARRHFLALHLVCEFTLGRRPSTSRGMQSKTLLSRSFMSCSSGSASMAIVSGTSSSSPSSRTFLKSCPAACKHCSTPHHGQVLPCELESFVVRQPVVCSGIMMMRMWPNSSRSTCLVSAMLWTGAMSMSTAKSCPGAVTASRSSKL